MIGEIGGTAEEEAAAWIKAHAKKTGRCFYCGCDCASRKKNGHAGAIISGGKGTAQREN